ncbi:glucose 1-dehydrogenase [Zavarzinia sp.]|uniref:glucose 1-dehydrogenase n=1 Tax=Zavarzinia sp. TaxID=2027920 RepID=UPI003BB7946E
MTANPHRLDGKVALITGAARGLGAETARVMGAAGATIMVTDVLEAEGRATVDGLKSAGITAFFRRHDVTLEADWNAAVDATIAEAGGLDILVNNAGIEVVHRIEDTTPEIFERVMRVNSTGTFLGMRAAITAMKPGGRAGRGGAIVNLSSIAGLRGFPGVTAYCASKGAVRLMTKAVAMECAALGYGIRVNSLHPGLIATDMGTALLGHFVAAGLGPDETTVAAQFAARQPLGEGRPSDIAEAALYLASDAARWVTGAELSVDGGFANG